MSPTADYNLGTARGSVVIDYRDTGTSKANADLQKLRASAKSTGTDFGSSAQSVERGGLAIGAALGLVVVAAARFEKRLSGIEAVSGATATQMDALRKKALQLGADTAFSAEQGAEAIEELVKAGVPLEDILNGAADAAVNLAAAGGIELADAASIASTAMNAFNLSGKDLGHVADLIAGAANASAIDVNQFNFAMQQASATAALAGFKFDDLATAIAVMGQAGIKGSDAGTSIKTFLQNLQPTTVKQTKLFNDLGITTRGLGNRFFDAAGNVKSMSEVAQVLQESLKGQTRQQKLLTLETLFGSDAIRAAAIFADAGAQGFDKMAASMGKVKAADVAATRLDNLSGDIEFLKGTAETLAITLGEILIPRLRDLAGGANSALTKISEMDDKTKTMIVDNAALAAGLALTVGVIGRMAVAVKALMAATKANPIVVAILLLAAAAVFAYKNFTTFRERVDTAIKAISVKADELWKKWGPTLKQIGETILGFLNGAWQDLQEAFAKLQTNFDSRPLLVALGAIAVVVGVVVVAIIAIIVIFAKFVKLIATVITAVVDFAQKINTGMRAARDAVFSAFGAIISFLGTVIGKIVGFFTGLGSKIGSATTTAFNAVKAAIVSGLNAVIAFFTPALNAIKAVWTAVWGFFGPFVKAIWNLINAIIFTAVQAILFAVRTTFNNVKLAITTILGAVVSFIRTKFNEAKAIVMLVVGAILAAIRAQWNAISSVTKTVFNAVVNAIRTAFNTAKSTVTSIANGIRSFLAGVWNGIISTVRSVIGQLPAPFRSGASQAIAVMRGLPGQIAGALGGLAGRLRQIGADAVQGLINGLRDRLGSITAIANTIADKIKSVGNLLKSKSPSRVMMEIGDDAVMGLIIGMRKLVSDVQDVAGNVAVAAQPDLAGSFDGALGALRLGPFQAQPSSQPAAASVQNINVDVEVPNGMNPAQVGELTARRIATTLSTRTSAPRTSTAFVVGSVTP